MNLPKNISTPDFLTGFDRTISDALGLRVILVSAHHDQARIFRDTARRAGTERFVQKDDPSLAVVSAWRATQPVT